MSGVDGHLSGSVDVELLHAVCEGAGGSPVTVGALTEALTQDHLDGPEAGGQRDLAPAGGRPVSSMSSISHVLQLVEAVGRGAVRTTALASLQPHPAQILLLSPHVLGDLRLEVLRDCPQLQLTCNTE